MPTVVDPSLTPAYIEVYNAIREAILHHKTAPSQTELRNALGCSSTTVVNALRELRKRGYIEHQKYTVRGLSLVDPELRLSRKPVDPWEEDLDTPRIWR